MSATIQHGNFSKLATNYSKYRPGYSSLVRGTIFSQVNCPTQSLDVVDIGAGTGIWTREMAKMNPRSIKGIEPNSEMLAMAKADSNDYTIDWIHAPAENTNLKDQSADIISMASSFHWTDFEKATSEFHRILKKNGIFVALWNPRNLNNPLLQEIEDYLYVLEPKMDRVSSGSGRRTIDLMEKMKALNIFEYQLYVEADLYREMSIEEYIGVWESVNDIRHQLGELNFRKFLDFIRLKTSKLKNIKVCNTTKAWIFKKLID